MSKTYFENGIEKNADTLQQIPMPNSMQGFTWDKLRGAFVQTTFDPLHGAYAKDDIIWLLPADYGTLWTPPTSEVTYPWTMPADHPFNLLGKPKTYQAQTSFRLQAIRLRSTKDNNTDNPITDKTSIGSSWVVDDPNALIESGSSSLGSIELFADGKGVARFITKTLRFTVDGGATPAVYTKPIQTIIDNSCTISYLLRNSGNNAAAGTIGFFGKYKTPETATTLTLFWSYFSTAAVNETYEVNTTSEIKWY